MQEIKRNKGITLIALVITIIVLLILAGISMATLMGENGLVTRAQDAKEQTEIGREKEIISLAVMSARMENENRKLEETGFRKALNEGTGEGKTDLVDIGEEFEVLFNESGRYYSVGKDGNIGDYLLIIKDENPGDITKNESGKTLAGTEEQPYEINCIEDLVAFSNIVSGSGVKFENGEVKEITSASDMRGKFIVLNRNLNFKSKNSYKDSGRTDFGDINGNIEDGNELMNEMTTGEGFKTIGAFNGCFDGKNNEIQDIYQDKPNNAGLFATTYYEAIIKNLNITGTMKALNNVGTIVILSNRGRIENCKSHVDLYNVNAEGIGGIVGSVNLGTIQNCVNYGNIESEKQGWGGGIVGINNLASIVNCYNEGDISVGGMAGGIVARSTGNIINCYNKGNVSTRNGIGYSYTSAGGIVGITQGKMEIFNCYNTGDISLRNGYGSSGTGGILGRGNTGAANMNIINCYNTGNRTKNAGGEGNILGASAGTTNILNCYYKKEDDSWYQEGTGELNTTTKEEIVQNMNDLIENNQEHDTSNWKKWKIGENGYPVIE